MLDKLASLANGLTNTTLLTQDVVMAFDAYGNVDTMNSHSQLAFRCQAAILSTSSVAIIVLPLVAHCFKASSKTAQRLRRSAGLMQVGTAAARVAFHNQGQKGLIRTHLLELAGIMLEQFTLNSKRQRVIQHSMTMGRLAARASSVTLLIREAL